MKPGQESYLNGLNITILGIVITLMTVIAFSCSNSNKNGGDTDTDPTCSHSSDCPLHWICDEKTGYCVKGECAEDLPCPDGEVCKDRACIERCSADSDCAGAQRCFPPDGLCYGGEYCNSDNDCNAPAGSNRRVTCNLQQKICEARFTPCTSENGWDVCRDDEYCHSSGWCAPRPAICTSDTCPPGTFCNHQTGKCENNPECDPGYKPDPVDGKCRLGLCTSDGECMADEWCDLMGIGMCRGKCQDDTGCLDGEKCDKSYGKCVKDMGCQEGDECTDKMCECGHGLICWQDPDKDPEHEYCLKSCAPFSGVSQCPSEQKCTLLADKQGNFESNRGACLAQRPGAKVGEACDDSTLCERDLFCSHGICRRSCDPSDPACGNNEICVDFHDVGLCEPKPTCSYDLDCNPPETICDLSSYPGACIQGCNQAGCNGQNSCNTETGRCDPGSSCVQDKDCGIPNYVCIEEHCSASCIFRGCRLPLLCNHTTGRCSHGCTVDLDCGPPEKICTEGECVQGCSGSGCPALETCDATTGRCSKDVCENDKDCNPPNTICDYQVTKLCVPGCIGVGCNGQGEICDTKSGRCIKSCVMDSDCNPPKETCRSGRCSPSCLSPDGQECPSGTECDPVTGRCKPTFCSKDSDCDPPYFVCDFGTSLCVHGCITNGCGPNQTCNQTTGRCQ
ncbi:MAG: hypothetical protein GXP49_00260 [Deltaproteobacteria bacterium]|nr:hypothetical protein [Deltaproteobacteria bacterium]